MQRIRKAGFVLLFAGFAIAMLGGCASGMNLHTAGATATDVSADRILVTVKSDSHAGIAELSPSGRLDYLPPAPEQVRAAERQRALSIASEFSDSFTLRLEEDWPIPALGVYCFVFRMAEPDPERRERIVAALAGHPGVESAQPLNFFYPRASHDASPADDPLDRIDAIPGTGLFQRASGRNVEIAVIDTGADLQHEDLAGANIVALDLVGDDDDLPAEHHGTSVLGVIAAQRDNGKGIGGYAPDANVLLLRACWQPRPRDEYAVCNSFTLAKALSYALQSDAAIVNLSVAGPRDPLLERLAALLDERGKLLVAAGDSRESFPASVTGSIVAAALLADSADGVMTLLPDDRYAIRQGTSIQAARVTGIATLIRELAPSIDVAELHQRLARLRTESAETVFADLLKPAAGRVRKVSATR
ncbi:MAG TPA: S8 family serine peptidase [Gammaproteobacteria bacterium]